MKPTGDITPPYICLYIQTVVETGNTRCLHTFGHIVNTFTCGTSCQFRSARVSGDTLCAALNVVDSTVHLMIIEIK